MSFSSLMAAALACELTAQTPPQVDLERTLWAGIKRALTGPDGEEYFQSSMKDAMLPRLKGILISAVPNDSGSSLVLGLTDSSTPEVALLPHDANARSTSELTPGVQIEFSGVPIGFTSDPFLVTFDLGDKDSIFLKPLGAIAPSWYIGPPLGVVRSSRYRNNKTRVEFDLPSDWTVEGTHPSIDNGDVAILLRSPLEGATAGVWMVRHKISAAEVSQRLLAALPDTVAQRAGLQCYSVRPESVQQTWISGRHALTGVADYEENGRKMSESLTWIVTEHTRALFFARIATYDLPIFQTNFDEIIDAAVVP
jgi:hypothetical protein